MSDKDERGEKRFFWFVVVPALLVCLAIFIAIGFLPEALSCESRALAHRR